MLYVGNLKFALSGIQSRSTKYSRLLFRLALDRRRHSKTLSVAQAQLIVFLLLRQEGLHCAHHQRSKEDRFILAHRECRSRYSINRGRIVAALVAAQEFGKHAELLNERLGPRSKFLEVSSLGCQMNESVASDTVLSMTTDNKARAVKPDAHTKLQYAHARPSSFYALPLEL